MKADIAFSTKEEEYISLSQSTRDLIPLREMLIELSGELKLPLTQINEK